ncbi:hypothetical protein SNOG_10655 [Parastagonospora nodorum SN15]|uniref:Uncharacterized protein n=1 Tax=Phaeosphaeria nodorum (strain SN15 / ATCC MYA-4574 / FGSC 10173) TaxID=321614 RepID=Q0UC59_PHANO|nr:hypothetical protein SNOG_10655 [Parastagonospora nodorum SN15]EAT82049.2 hypothetical protein SNOG_10655 [Parastagonospora nodorum SN15]
MSDKASKTEEELDAVQSNPETGDEGDNEGEDDGEDGETIGSSEDEAYVPPQTVAQWTELEHQTARRHSGRATFGSCLKEATARADQAARVYSGNTSDEEDEEDEESAEDESEDEEGMSEEDAEVDPATIAMIHRRSRLPENTLGPAPGTIGAEASEDDSDDSTYVDMDSDQSSDDDGPDSDYNAGDNGNQAGNNSRNGSVDNPGEGPDGEVSDDESTESTASKDSGLMDVGKD